MTTVLTERDRPTYVVRAVRDDGWWGLTVPDVPGAISQVRRLRDAATWIREVVAFMLKVPEDSFDLEVRPDLPDGLTDAVEAARQATRAAEQAQLEAARRSREVARRLHELGITGSDIATITRLSPQRVSQLLRKRPHE